MALRLAFDIGLHLNMSGSVSAGKLTPAEAELRRTVFWSSYTSEQ